MSDGQFRVEWRDGRADPKCAPNPAYPDGIDADASLGATQTCTVALAYPAKRIGMYLVERLICGIRVGCTTAGRPDDPRSLKVACRPMANA